MPVISPSASSVLVDWPSLIVAAYSFSVGGQRAYKLTRAGAAPELQARPVTVYQFEVTAVRRAGAQLDIDATVRCSSGTYIRALARDLGAALGTGGHLTRLRRTKVGGYGVRTPAPWSSWPTGSMCCRWPRRPRRRFRAGT